MSSLKQLIPPAKNRVAEPEEELITPPPRPEMSASPPRIIVIGAGSRGRTYARAVQTSCNGLVVAVAEPDDYKRGYLGRNYIWGAEGSPAAEGAQFADWREFIAYEKQRRERASSSGEEESDILPAVDAAFVCVMDEIHREVVVALCELGGQHILCEKPLATTLDDCVDMYAALKKNDHVFSVGHVLRYSPHNMMLRKLLLEDRVIGDTLSVVHTEPVGWWHFSHSYVRGNWRRQSNTAPTLLTRSCHDMDVVMWLMSSPHSSADAKTPPHLPSTVTSSGALQYFKKSRKPAAAGPATNCLSCPIEESCKYSAKKIYVGGELRGYGTGNTGWPVKIAVPDIEEYGSAPDERGQEALLAKLREDYDDGTPHSEVAKRNWFGRCVYECDNDVCDDQFVTVTWDEDPLPSSLEAAAAAAVTSDPMGGRGAKTATFHMVAQTKKICDRYTHIYGVDGEIYADSRTITVEDFRTGETKTYRPRLESKGHGGGDVGLARQFVLAVDKAKNHAWGVDRAQRELLG